MLVVTEWNEFQVETTWTTHPQRIVVSAEKIGVCEDSSIVVGGPSNIENDMNKKRKRHIQE